MPMLAEGSGIDSIVDAGLWHDMGTPQRFLDGALDWARADWPERLWRRSWISPEASLGAGARVRRSSIEPGAKVGEGARIERSVLLPGARIGKGCVVRESIVGFGAAVPPGTWVERRIVMPQSPGFAPGLDDSVVGGAVYTPFGPRRRRLNEPLPSVMIAGPDSSPVPAMPLDPHPFRLLVFDWDGTLMDSIGTIVACTQATIRELELGELPEKTIRGMIGLGLRETIETLSPGCDEQLFGRILEGYRKHWHTTYRDMPLLFTGVGEMLRELAAEGYLLAVATGKSRRGLDYALEQTGLRRALPRHAHRRRGLLEASPQDAARHPRRDGGGAGRGGDDRRHHLRSGDGAQRADARDRRLLGGARPRGAPGAGAPRLPGSGGGSGGLAGGARGHGDRADVPPEPYFPFFAPAFAPAIPSRSLIC